jgi:hypothetical protein
VWWLIGSYLLLVLVLPVVLSLAAGYRGLPDGARCPRCAGDTLRLLAPWLRRASPVLPAVLQRRWCLCCGWEGIVRMPRRCANAGATAVARTAPATPPATGVKETGARRSEPLRRGTQTLDVRSLTVDGAPWRVMLQCWASTGLIFGRFVFVAPSGRLLLDSVAAISGRSEDEVLGQALALPDRHLARRLRRLVSDRA